MPKCKHKKKRLFYPTLLTVDPLASTRKLISRFPLHKSPTANQAKKNSSDLYGVGKVHVPPRLVRRAGPKD